MHQVQFMGYCDKYRAVAKTKKDVVKTVVWFVCFTLILIVVSWGGWTLERWLNWTLFYGEKVEKRIEELDQRLKAIEGKERDQR
jgi:hypothetical protein